MKVHATCNKAKRKATWATTASVLLFAFHPTPLRADFFGGDVVVLGQILVNAIQQLTQLRQILGAGQDSLTLMRDINRGINDSLRIIKTISPDRDPGIYREWQRVQDALQGLEQVYGRIVPSKNERIQRDADQSVAEAISLNNSIYDYTKQIDDVGEAIEAASHAVSPGGAQKLTAQSLGVILHVLNTSLRTQATGLKLHAQQFAIENRRDKEETRATLDATDRLTDSMKSQDTSFQIPRF